eukprot:Awhi_evm2s11264
MENRCNRHSLDLSCFERLITNPHRNEEVLPLRILNYQHRQHPRLADLIRPTLYKSLKDAPGLAEERNTVP